MRRQTISLIAAVTIAGSLGCQSKGAKVPASSTATTIPSASPPQAAIPSPQPPPSAAEVQTAVSTAPPFAPLPTFSPNELNADPNAAAKRISLEQASNAWSDGSALLVDVRTDDQWKDGHIKGAIHIPESEVLSHLDKLSKQRLIITYCS